MSIRQRLIRIEDEFLSAVTEGSVEFFNDELWTPLAKDVESAIQSSSLDTETISLAHVTSQRIAMLAEIFHDLHVDNERLTSDVMDEVDAILSRLNISDTSSPLHPSRSHPNEENVFQSLVERGPSPMLDQQLLLSPTPSLVSLSTADDTDEDIIPSFIVGRKRKASSQDFDTGTVRSDRVNKRLRTSCMSSGEVDDIDQKYVVVSKPLHDTLPPASLSPMSTPPRINRIQNPPSCGGVALEPRVQPLRPSPSSRKRRLSDADALPIPKRPRGSLAGSWRPHAVSDPFPVTSTPIVVQCLDDWFEVHFSIPEVPSLSWSNIEPSASLQTEFFNAWSSTGVTVTNVCGQIIDLAGNAASQVTDSHDLQPIMCSSCEITTPGSFHECGVSSNITAEITLTGSVMDPSSVSNSIELPIFLKDGPTSTHSSLPAKSTEVAVRVPASRDIISRMALGPSPPAYQLDSLDTSGSLEADVISLYTTLDDLDLPPVSAACSGISEPDLDLFVDSPPTFSESMSSEERWTQFLAGLEQPPEIILPTPPPPYNPSADVTRLLESLLQSVEGSTIPTVECTQVMSDKQNKLEQLEAAKEAVRRLEVEVGITASI